MKFLTVCMECINDDEFMGSGTPSIAYIPDSGHVLFICDRGHKSIIATQQLKFEILSEIAIWAIHDHYYREAISSFTSSLERLYELLFWVIARKQGLTIKDIELGWKPFKSSSERQFGAAAALFLSENKQPLVAVPRKYVELRNNVIHNGKIPSRDEAIEYGRAISVVASEILTFLKNDTYTEYLHEAVVNNLTAKSSIAESEGVSLSTVYMRTFFSIVKGISPDDIESRVAEKSKYPSGAQQVVEPMVGQLKSKT